MTKKTILLVISLAFLLGGIVRLFAGECTFDFFQMGHLWSGDAYFVYIYRLLAVFVIWVGLILLVCSRDIIRYRGVIIVSMLALLLFFVVSLLVGFATGLGLRFFLFDSIFALLLVVLLYVIQKG